MNDLTSGDINSKIEFNLNELKIEDDSNNNNKNQSNLNENNFKLDESNINSIIENNENNRFGSQTKLIIISPSSLVQQQQTNQHQQNMSSSPQIVINGTGTTKIARDSLIHKNDMFQFDDVESIQTSKDFI